MVSTKKVLVVGATGATGKYVVQFLLDKGQNVIAVARSQEKMMSLLKQEDYGTRLFVKEASITDMSNEEFVDLTKDCQAIVSCLGHNLTFGGMYKDGYFVSSGTKSLTTAMPKGCRFIMMGSDGVSNPDGSDPIRPLLERTVLFLLRWLVPPHSDNEMAALYLHQHRNEFDWSVVRPTDLIDGEVSEYDIFDTQIGSLFGDGVATRANVADMMVELVMEESTFQKYNHKMPVLYDKKKPGKADTTKSSGKKSN